MTAEVIMEPALLPHEGIWTEEEYLALPKGLSQRIELIDGALYMSPPGDAPHQNYGARVWRELDRQLPDEYAPFHEAGVRLSIGRIVIPDVVVSTNLGTWKVVGADEVVLTGEVVSPSSKAMDRILKPGMFAEAGIPWYLRVERDPRLLLVLHRLDGETYVEQARAGRGDRLEIPELSCAIEVDALLRRRG